MTAPDPLRATMRSADHWVQLGWAEAWANVARGLDASGHSASARLAWRWAWDGFDAYREAHRANLPASRWDHDFGPECADARQRAAARAPANDEGPSLPTWLRAALDGHLTDAVAAIPPSVADATEREALRALSIALGAAGQHAEVRRVAAAAGIAVP